MQIKKIRVNGRDGIVKLAAFIGLGSFVAQIMEMDAVASALFACSLVCVTVNYVSFAAARNRMRLDDIILFLLTLITIVASDWQLNFEYYKPAIIVTCTILCIDQCVEIKVSRKACKTITLLLIAVCAITNILYYNGLRYAYYGTTTIINLNFSNPNLAAMWLVFLIVLLGDSVSVQDTVRMKLLSLVCMASLLPMLIRTESRNCLIAILFFFIGKVLLLFPLKKLPRWCLFLITMAPILVYVGYMYIFIPYYDRLSGWFSFLVSEGKPLTSRSRIWSDLETHQMKQILFGNYTVYHTEQLHNSMLTLYCRFGVFYVAIVCRKLYRVLKRMPNIGMQLALGTVWLTGCFETSFFVGSAGMYMMLLLLPVYHQLHYEIQQ